MRRHYAPKTFFRHVPFAYLRQFFDQAKIGIGLDWAGLDERDVDPVFAAWQQLHPDARERAELVFRQVHELATRDGVRVLIEEGLFRDRDLAADLAEVDGHHAKALWVYLNYSPAFLTAWQIYHAETLPGRYWRRRTGFADVPPDLTQGAVTAFRAALSDYLRREQGRGHRCTIDPYDRGARGAYLFVYPDDYTSTYVGHDPSGRLQRRAQRPAFEVVFYFHAQSGVLDLFAQGDRRQKDAIEDLFCQHILRQPSPAERPNRAAYVLNPLKVRGFPFRTDPEDAVREVRVRRLRLGLPNLPERVMIEASPDGPVNEIHDVLDRWLNLQHCPLVTINVSQVTLQIRHTPPGETRERTLTFDVTYPNGCNLKSMAEDERELGEKYLRQWGIARD